MACAATVPPSHWTVSPGTAPVPVPVPEPEPVPIPVPVPVPVPVFQLSHQHMYMSCRSSDMGDLVNSLLDVKYVGGDKDKERRKLKKKEMFTEQVTKGVKMLEVWQ